MAEDQLKQAEAFKEEGNRHHGEGNFKKALAAYHKVFCYVNGLQSPTGDAPAASSSSSVVPKDRVEDLKRLKQSTRLNMAACYLKLGEPQKCIDACSQVLEHGALPKAHFRRAQAYAELRNFSGAVSDLERARVLAPDDAAIAVELKRVRHAFMQGDAAEKSQCAKMFATGDVLPSGEEATGGQKQEDEATGCNDLLADEQKTEAVRPGTALANAPSGAQRTVAAALGVPSASGSGVDGARRKGESTLCPAPPDLGETTSSSSRSCPREVKDEVRKLDVQVRELQYAWQQSDEDIKIYVSFDQSDELEGGVDESRVEADFAEWSCLLLIKSNVEGRAPLGLRLGDFHRRLAPEKCRCTVRGSRITLKMPKQEPEHWWNLLQNASPG
ncbi:unnamed protein product [Polarella glacialis]|uniref:CS domain-containing protein n=1 Tax=Polarella glacialis TaxID=89957 RepID=A0A813HE52_POLGL|nr:unnamed protein product [Polarella glacialis]CAE8705617.1 unnamed protein product [Polarella glacialis]